MAGLPIISTLANCKSIDLFHRKTFFVGLQAADLLTTLACFHFGVTESNPVTVYLIALFGTVAGLLIAKSIACAVVLPMKKLVWLGNLIYSGIVIWNALFASMMGLVHLAKRG